MERVERYLEQMLRAGLRKADRALIEAPTFVRNLRTALPPHNNFEKVLGTLTIGGATLNLIAPQTINDTFIIWALGGAIYWGLTSNRLRALK